MTTMAASARRSSAPVALFYALTLSAVLWAWHRAPIPLADDPADGSTPRGASLSPLFSEERAMSHVSHLSRTIGHRQVGTPGLEEAEAYLRKEAEKIAGVCEVTGTCEAKVSVSTVSGAFQYNKTGSPLYLSYAGLRNVLLTISPKGSEAKDKALLVNAHFDSALGSPGAADCASCVAVALESARALAASPDPPKVAVLLNGGEEVYMNAVHGFVGERGGPAGLRSEFSAFINLEATGSYGPDVVFRASSETLVGAYVKRAPRPRATVLAQDIFGSGVVPSDTDYSVLGGDKFGGMTGMDLATMLDSRSYHCARDTYDRIKTGSLQAYGENVVEVLRGAGEVLRGNATDAVGDLVYFDLLGLFVASYPMAWARAIHLAPLAVASVLAVLRGPRGLLGALGGAVAAAASATCCLVLPALAALAACIPGGRSAMSWYGSPVEAALLFFPAALAGLLLPYSACFNRRDGPAAKGAGLLGWDAFYSALLGNLIAFSSLSALMTINGAGLMRHSGYIFALWAFSSVAWVAARRAQSDSKSLAGAPGFDLLAWALHTVPLCACANVCAFAWLFFCDRLGLMGGGGEAASTAFSSFLGAAKADITLGIITGVCVLVCVGPCAPWILCSLPSRADRLRALRALLVLSLAAQCGSRLLHLGGHGGGHTERDPKRVFVQRSVSLEESLWAKVVPSGLALGLPFKGLRRTAEGPRWTLLGADASPFREEALASMPDLSAEDLLAPAPEHLLPYYPKPSKMKDAYHFEDSQLSRDLNLEIPKFRKRVSATGSKEGGRRCDVLVETSHPGYHSLNLTVPAGGKVSRWSFTEGEVTPSGGGGGTYVLHHAANGEEGRRWRWWFEWEGAGTAAVSWTYTNVTSSLREVERGLRLPDWVTPIAQTTYVHTFRC